MHTLPLGSIHEEDTEYGRRYEHPHPKLPKHCWFIDNVAELSLTAHNARVPTLR